MDPGLVDSIASRVDRQPRIPYLWEAMARREIRRDPSVLD